MEPPRNKDENGAVNDGVETIHYSNEEEDGEGQEDDYYDEEEEEEYQANEKYSKGGRRALTESEQDDLDAEAAYNNNNNEETNEDEPKDEHQELTLDEYLASKKPSALLEKLKANMQAPRQANEGHVSQFWGQKDDGIDLEKAASSESFKEEVTFTPALTAPTMSWTTIRCISAPSPRVSHASCVIDLYPQPPILMIHGGRDNSAGLLNDIWWFDSRNEHWTRRNFHGFSPSPRQAHTLTFLPSNSVQPARVFLIGGNTMQGRADKIHTLTNTATGWTWGVKHEPCSGRVHSGPIPASSLSEAAKHIVWCGCKGWNYSRQTIEQLKPHWCDIPSALPDSWKSISSHTAVAFPQSVCVFGGRAAKHLSNTSFTFVHPTQVRVSTDTNITIKETNTGRLRSGKVNIKAAMGPFLKVQEMKNSGRPPAPRYGHAAAFMPLKGMFIVGGADEQDEFDDVWLMDHSTFAWQRVHFTGYLPPLVSAAAVAVDHLLYIFGGFTKGVAVANLFVLDTKANVMQQLDIPGTVPAARGMHTMNLVGDAIYIFGGTNEQHHMFSDLVRINNVSDFGMRISHIGSNLLSLFETSLLSDFSIVPRDGKIIRCHQAILAARCPYFRDFIQSNPTDHLVRSHELPFDSDALIRVIRFMYHDSLRVSAEQAPEMLRLAQHLYMPQVETICNSIQQAPIVPPSKLSGEMQWLLDSAMCADVELVAGAGGKIFKAHRSILSVRCPFFKAMFSSQFKEGQPGACVTMSEMDQQHLEALLQFLYCEKVDPQAHQLAFELLGQCELLELADLRERCARILIKAISYENLSLLYSAGEMFKAHSLSSAVFHYAYQEAIRSGGLDEELIAALSPELLKEINEGRARNFLPALARKRDETANGAANAVLWNSYCQCGLPYAYSHNTWAQTNNKLPKDLLAEKFTPLKYEAVLSLTMQIGHRAKVLLPTGDAIAPSLPRNTRRDAEQQAALSAWHVTQCNLVLSSLV